MDWAVQSLLPYCKDQFRNYTCRIPFTRWKLTSVANPICGRSNPEGAATCQCRTPETFQSRNRSIPSKLRSSSSVTVPFQGSKWRENNQMQTNTKSFTTHSINLNLRQSPEPKLSNTHLSFPSPNQQSPPLLIKLHSPTTNPFPSSPNESSHLHRANQRQGFLEKEGKNGCRVQTTAEKEKQTDTWNDPSVGSSQNTATISSVAEPRGRMSHHESSK